MHCRCELDALTLRLELSDDQLVRNATHRFTISVKCTQSWKLTTTTTQTTKKQYWQFVLKMYWLYTNWFKPHNRILIYQSHTKPFYVQYHQPERFCPRALHVICPNAKYTWQSPGKMLQSEIQEGFCPDSSSSSGNKMKSFQDDVCEWKNLSHNLL